MWADPNNATYNSIPVAATTYNELTFTYNLTINPTTDTVTLQENHVIGRIRDLVVFDSDRLSYVHYNSTGEYELLGLEKISNTTVYDYLDSNNIKMSILNYQTSTVVGHTTYCSTPSGQDVNGTTDTDVSDSSINTYTDTGEKIFTSDFGSKQQYKLYNYTADPTESTYNTYDSITRIVPIAGYAADTGLFSYQMEFASYLPLTIYHMSPGLYDDVKDSVANMSRADYLYIISYPTYSGFKIVHDPTFTAYATITQPSTQISTGAGLLFLVIIAVILVAVIALAATSLKRHKQTEQKQNTNS